MKAAICSSFSISGTTMLTKYCSFEFISVKGKTLLPISNNWFLSLTPFIINSKWSFLDVGLNSKVLCSNWLALISPILKWSSSDLSLNTTFIIISLIPSNFLFISISVISPDILAVSDNPSAFKCSSLYLRNSSSIWANISSSFANFILNDSAFFRNSSSNWRNPLINSSTDKVFVASKLKTWKSLSDIIGSNRPVFERRFKNWINSAWPTRLPDLYPEFVNPATNESIFAFFISKDSDIMNLFIWF